jgi:hypothetical protein
MGVFNELLFGAEELALELGFLFQEDVVAGFEV